MTRQVPSWHGIPRPGMPRHGAAFYQAAAVADWDVLGTHPVHGNPADHPDCVPCTQAHTVHSAALAAEHPDCRLCQGIREQGAIWLADSTGRRPPMWDTVVLVEVEEADGEKEVTGAFGFAGEEAALRWVHERPGPVQQVQYRVLRLDDPDAVAS